MSLYSEIKKYLLYLVGFFCLLVAAHSILLYFYADAKVYPLPGGTINIGVIGEVPSLDVLSVDTKLENDTNDMVLQFLYRGILRYSLEDKKIVGDLANCSIDSFPYVRCTLNQNALWNDGRAIETEDVLATYSLFKESARNESTKNRLAILDVSADKGDIVFHFKTDDVTVLDTLFLPILRKKDMGGFSGNNDFSTLSFNGPYIFSEKDTKTGAMTLKKNPIYGSIKDMYFLDQVRFGFGTTKKDVEKSIEPDIWIGDTDEIDSGFLKYTYFRPNLYSIYLNADRIHKTLRSALFYDVFNRIDLKNYNFIHKENVFLGEVSSSPTTAIEMPFYQTAFSLGYAFGGTAPAPAPSATPKPSFVPLQNITQPGNNSPLFLSSDLVDIRGVPPAGTTKVVVNDYALRGYQPGNKTFSYTARKEFRNLIDGENLYKVQFFAGQKLLREEKLVVYYNTDPKILETVQKDWIQKNTPVVENKPVVIANTDPKKLYDKNGKILQFRIVYQSEVPVFEEIAKKIQEILKNLSVDTSLEALPLQDIKKMVAEQNPTYDILLTGINLGLFHYNVLPFFHSGQIKNGSNMSRLRNATLDTTMEKLIDRLYYNAPDKLRIIESEIQTMIEGESVVFPLGTPEESWYIKNYVLGVNPPSFFSGKEMMFDILSRSYLKEGYKRSSESKTVFGFFLWLKNELFSST